MGPRAAPNPDLASLGHLFYVWERPHLAAEPERARFGLTAVVPAFLLLVAGCARSPERVSDAAVRAALDRLRDAPSADDAGRRARVVDLKATSAETPEGQRARDSCALAYTLLLDGKAMLALARSTDAGAADVGAVERKLTDAEAAMTECNAASGALVVAVHR
ncbi:MAG TPA: hypothetical protein VGM56_20875 [Byssovorax sp.]|jgi:hypothetical protein